MQEELPEVVLTMPARTSMRKRMEICNDAKSTLEIAHSFMDYLQEATKEHDPIDQMRWRSFNERIHVEAMQLEMLLLRLEEVRISSISFTRLTNRLLLAKSRVNTLIRNVQEELSFA